MVPYPLDGPIILVYRAQMRFISPRDKLENMESSIVHNGFLTHLIGLLYCIFFLRPESEVLTGRLGVSGISRPHPSGEDPLFGTSTMPTQFALLGRGYLWHRKRASARVKRAHMGIMGSSWCSCRPSRDRRNINLESGSLVILNLRGLCILSGAQPLVALCLRENVKRRFSFSLSKQDMCHVIP